ncbi:TetR/AcrR family transcriptional regulator [Brenneria izadpanahii]|uniref:TetR/AcrR family transcriptional regulator n=1 Tax=Brenneria izadpanahii TaxID=2722756 RepID=A0ABX7UU90_9GAMM|nr:TetR/AcrR family transcriptional regulator [Brenneria izadpanahii]QTF09159.1 TetR/AcrR family transcriptional regulator [Brenneria izadpanahii]
MEISRKKPVPKRGRPKVIGDQERRRSIIKGAYEAFIELGFARTTTAVIAAKARVSKRSIYEVFSNKTALFAAVIHEHQHLILDLPRPQNEMLPLLDTLIEIFRLNVDEEADRAREAMLNLIVRESIQFPELSDYLYENEIIRSREALIDWLRIEADRGRMAVDDLSVCAGMLMDIVFGALLPHRRVQQQPERACRIEHIKKRLEIFLRGIQANPMR